MSPQHGVSRRGFMKGVAGTAAVPGAFAGMAASSAQAAPAEVNVAATVVRVNHSRVERHALRVGVRTSIQGPDVELDNVVLVVDRIPFSASPEEIRSRIAAGVQEQVAELLARRGVSASGKGAAVQVFGGVLG